MPHLELQTHPDWLMQLNCTQHILIRAIAAMTGMQRVQSFTQAKRATGARRISADHHIKPVLARLCRQIHLQITTHSTYQSA